MSYHALLSEEPPPFSAYSNNLKLLQTFRMRGRSLGKFSSGGLAMIKLKRVYEEEERSDGIRYLVERLWPRGIKKTS